MEDCLPSGVLEAILGFLDLETLCTARLVSRTFCAAASAHIHCLTLKHTSPVSSHRFPRLQHVAMHYKMYGNVRRCTESLAEIDPCLRDIITSLKLGSIRPVAETLSHVASMPKLRYLKVCTFMTQGAAWLRRLTQLEALNLGRCSIFMATRVVRMTRLTSLTIGVVYRVGDREGIADFSWLKHATNLRNLQALDIETSQGALPLVGNLTGLTGLTMYEAYEAGRNMYDEEDHSMAPLTHLTRLRSLDINWGLSASNLEVACSLGSGSLVSLTVTPGEEASTHCGRLLSRQTALTELVVRGWGSWDLRNIAALRIELLQSLDLCLPAQLECESISALCRATCLTELDISTNDTQTYLGLSQVLSRLPQLLTLRLCLEGDGITQPHMALSQALAQLTQLRALEMYMGWWYEASDTKILNLHMALSPLTGLTLLAIAGGGLDNEDMRALFGLTCLRELALSNCPVTDDAVRDLGVLTNLHSLVVANCGVSSLIPVTEVLDPLRARGLPPMFTLLSPRRARVGSGL